MKKLYVSALLLGLFAIACNSNYKQIFAKDLVVVAPDGPSIWEGKTEVVSFDQGWNDEMKNDFWFTSQGAEIIPYTWFTWLEQPGNDKLFRSAEHMDLLGYLPADSSRINPAGLPIGFAITQAKEMEDAFVGFTCAACHTHLVEYKDTAFLIDGAPTLANFVGLFDELVDALNITYQDNKKFERFARNVLSDKYTVGTADELRQKLLTYAEATADRQLVNALPADYPADFTSYGRLDAFTNIENAGTAFALNMLENRNAAIAPVSYPFLWGTHQSDVVQWNGSAPNIPRAVGPMVRNAGEVVGVFGGLEIEKATGLKKFLGGKHKYSSTVDFAGLGRLEGFIAQLKAPAWNDSNSNLPRVDLKAVARGKLHFQSMCQSCHEVIPASEQYRNYKSKLVSVKKLGTDVVTAWAGDHHKASSGILKGSKDKIVVGDVMGDTVQSIVVPVNGVVGIVLANPRKTLKGVLITAKEAKKVSHRKDIDTYIERRDSLLEDNADQHKEKAWIVKDGKRVRNPAGLEYKARPLNGIWATAPFLHNGSVPNLWELLKKPEERVESFWVGSRRFDPKHVGFVTDRGKNQFRVKHKQGIMPGNSNRGHNYGTKLTDAEKWDLLEYIKTL